MQFQNIVSLTEKNDNWVFKFAFFIQDIILRNESLLNS